MKTHQTDSRQTFKTIALLFLPHWDDTPSQTESSQANTWKSYKTLKLWCDVLVFMKVKLMASMYLVCVRL